MKFFSGWIGISLFVIGLLSLVFQSDLPEASRIDPLLAITITFAGVLFMYSGRRYLPGWLGQLFTGSDGDSD